MTRKQTVRIVELINLVNKRNKLSTGSVNRDMRTGVNSFIERILMDANVYAGFGYYTASDVPVGQLPGIVPNPADPNGPHEFPDESRRFYYYHRSLKLSRIRSLTVNR